MASMPHVRPARDRRMGPEVDGSGRPMSVRRPMDAERARAKIRDARLARAEQEEPGMGRTPVGVGIIGFLVLMAGVAHVLAGLTLMGYVAFWEGDAGQWVVPVGRALTLVIGLVFVVSGIALWWTFPWAWTLTNFVAVLGLLDAVFVLFATHDVSPGLAVALLPAVVLWYLNQPNIKAAFQVDDSGG